MESTTIPVPAPRRSRLNEEAAKAEQAPIPMPRTKPRQDRDFFKSIETRSKQLGEDISSKVQDGSKLFVETTTNIKEKTKMAKQKLEDSFKTTSKMAREKVSSSVFEGRTRLSSASKHFNSLRKKRDAVLTVPMEERTVSMPPTDTVLFDSIQFHSPFHDQPEYGNLNSNNSSLSFLSRIDTGSCDNSDKMSEVSEYSSISVPSPSLSQCDSTRTTENIYNTPRNSESSCYGLVSNSTTNTENTNANGDILQQVPLRPTQTRQSKLNNQYENWSMLGPDRDNSRPSKSMMDQFDPLQNLSIDVGQMNDLSLIETLLAGDTYGKISDYTDQATSDDSECEFYWENKDSFTSPPTPPERFDSLEKSESLNNVNSNLPKETEKDKMSRKTSWYLNVDEKKNKEVSQKQINSVKNRFSNMFKLVPESASFLKKKIEQSSESYCIPDKLVIPQTLQQHRGLMVRLSAGGMEEIFKNFQPKLCVLAEKKLTCYSDQTNSVTKETYLLKNVFSLQIIMSHKFNFDGELHCFQINYGNQNSFKNNRNSVVFGCTNEGERSGWVHSIIESLSNAFPVECVSGFSRFGWCHLKEGVSGTWEAAWLLLRKRSLHYCINQDRTIHNMDLKKARFVVLQDVDDKKDLPGEDKTILLIDFPETTLYLQMGSTQETTMWRKIIKKAALNNGAWIHHQQLTKENVPTLVDKCINFVYMHGSLSEGIYRKAGTGSMVTGLLTAFRHDSWAIQLTRNNYSEHDVASALKRFFRDLPEALLTNSLREQLCAVSEMSTKEDKIAAYKELIKNLHPVSFNTLKKLMAHLHFIHSLHTENLMNSSNLAAIWGPTLMSCPDSSDMQWSRKETVVVHDLIDLYEQIYEPSDEDINKEKLMLSVLKKYQQSNAPTTKKRSGDFQVWVYLNDKKSEDCVSVMIGPNKTCGDICEELSEKMGKKSHLLLIEEVITDESMTRPLHHSEILLNVVLRWGYWDDCDRKDNYLVIKDNTFLARVASTVIPPMNPTTFSMDLKFANDKQRTFKSYHFIFSQAKFSYFKDKNASTQLGIWSVEDIRWYIGHESKRNPQAKWSITFIEKNSKTLRTKEKPHFGNIIASNNEEDLIKWIAAFLYAEYPDSIIPIPKLIQT